MLALGLLLLVDQQGGWSFFRTWPALIIVYGLWRLLEQLFASSPASVAEIPAPGPVKRSMVAPVLLILVGVVLLWKNWTPGLSWWQWLARWWPMLLVVWGGLRALEILWWAYRRSAVPARGISGAGWTLAWLLVLAALPIQHIPAHISWAPAVRWGLEAFGETYDYPLEGKQPCSPTDTVVVEHGAGDVEVLGTPGAQEVAVTGRLWVRALRPEQAQQTRDASQLELARQPGRVIVRLRRGMAPSWVQSGVDMTIRVPESVRLVVRGADGEYALRGLRGEAEVQAERASVRLEEVGPSRIELRAGRSIWARNIHGTLEVRGRGHEVELENIDGLVTIDGNFTGQLWARRLPKGLSLTSRRTELRFAELTGECRMDWGELNAEGLAGPVRVKSQSRDVRLGDFRGDVEIALERGDVSLDVGPTAARMNVTVESGDVELWLPPEAEKWVVDAEVAHGKVISEFGGWTVLEVGEGARIAPQKSEPPRLRIRVDRGELVLHKRVQQAGRAVSSTKLTPLRVEEH